MSDDNILLTLFIFFFFFLRLVEFCFCQGFEVTCCRVAVIPASRVLWPPWRRNSRQNYSLETSFGTPKFANVIFSWCNTGISGNGTWLLLSCCPPHNCQQNPSFAEWSVSCLYTTGPYHSWLQSSCSPWQLSIFLALDNPDASSRTWLHDRTLLWRRHISQIRLDTLTEQRWFILTEL